MNQFFRLFWIVLMAFAVTLPQIDVWAQSKKRVVEAEAEDESEDEDPYGVKDPEEEMEELDRKSQRDWKKHPGFFHFGLGGEFNLSSVPASMTGATNPAYGVGLGGVAILDYDFTRYWLFGFRFMGGYKRLLLSSDETLPSGGMNVFTLSAAIQKLKRVSRITTFRYGIGVSFEFIDTPSAVVTDNAIVLTLDFDFPHVFTGFRGYLYTLRPSAHFLGFETILGLRF